MNAILIIIPIEISTPTKSQCLAWIFQHAKVSKKKREKIEQPRHVIFNFKIEKKKIKH
jgi:hypothetical protein